jgi:hypothetical protein
MVSLLMFPLVAVVLFCERFAFVCCETYEMCQNLTPNQGEREKNRHVQLAPFAFSDFVVVVEIAIRAEAKRTELASQTSLAA